MHGKWLDMLDTELSTCITGHLITNNERQADIGKTHEAFAILTALNYEADSMMLQSLTTTILTKNKI